MTVLAPHCAGAARQEVIDGMTIRRFRYAPARLERLAYEGGMAVRLSRSPGYWALAPLFMLGQLAATVRLLRSDDFQAIHAHWLIPQGVTAVLARILARRWPRLVCTAHGSDLYGFRGRLGALAKRLAIRGADGVAVVSRPMVTEIKRLVGDASAVVAPMGVDLRRRFTPEPSTRPEPDRIVFVGRLVDGKGADRLIAALPAVLARFPKMKLLIVGDGQKREELVRRVKRLGLAGCVDFVGVRGHEELPGMLRRAAMVVLPFERDEGLGLTVIEALGCGCPVIVGDVPAIRDIVEPGITGIIVDPRDVHALAEAILAIRRDPKAARTMAMRGRDRVVVRYDWDSVGDRYVKLLSA